ncbi:Uncharacterised protein [uncultured archaeon]|nr:Uncharacterised protein [uncultured archaeon]
MEELVWKLRITVLWIILAAGCSGTQILYILAPGVINNIIAGKFEGMEINTGFLIVFSLFWLIPLTMAFLTLVLKERTNRYTNAALGLFFGIYLIFSIVLPLSMGQEFSGHLLLEAVGVIIAFLIVWHAWKWPKLNT